MIKFNRIFGFTSQSYYLFSAFVLTCLLICYVWWPLVQEYLGYMDGRLPWYDYVDWLLIGLFLFMSFCIMAMADLKADGLIVLVGVFGGLVIESWGTQTNIWHYYTNERPPLWIIPAWPIASLTIDRITRALDYLLRAVFNKLIPQNTFRIDKIIYWLIFSVFLFIMFWFVSPTISKSYTIMALILCVGLILTTQDKRMAILIFASGTALGYFLEVWGTTRGCWIYYTGQTPPLFAVLAHGMAAFAFYRSGQLIKLVWSKLRMTQPDWGT